MPAEHATARLTPPLGLSLTSEQERLWQELLDCHVKTQRTIRLLQFRQARQEQAFQRVMRATEALKDAEERARTEAGLARLDEAERENGSLAVFDADQGEWPK